MKVKRLTKVNVMVKMMVVMVTLCPGLALSDALGKESPSTTTTTTTTRKVVGLPANHQQDHRPPQPPQQQQYYQHHLPQPLHHRHPHLQHHHHTSPPHPYTLHHHHQQQYQSRHLRDHQTKALAEAQQYKVINKTELYAFCLNFSARFQAHVSDKPSLMFLDDLRPHLWTLFRELDFLPFVSEFVEAHVGVISTAHDTRALYNLLDLYSALEALRQQHLQEVMERLVFLAEENPDVPGRFINPLVHMVPGFVRHINTIRRNMTTLYRLALEPGRNNVEFVARYQPNTLPKLDLMMANLSLPPSPFLSMDGGGYVLRPADHPYSGITVQHYGGGSWGLAAATTTTTTPSTSSVFSFEPVQGKYGAVQYVLTSALLPATYHLIIPPDAARRKEILYFDTQEGGALDVMKLPGEEHVLVHKIKKFRDQVLYLYWRAQDAQVGLTSSYPGREAHWLLQATTTAPDRRLTPAP